MGRPYIKEVMIYHRLPLCITLEVTSKCNLNCAMCGYPHMTRAKAHMDFSLFQTIVQQCKYDGHNLMWLHHIGEPTLWPYLCEGIEYMRYTLGRTPCISTNGMLLDSDMLKNLKAAGAGHVMICFSSMREDVYNILRRGGNYHRVIQNIHTAKDMNCFDITVQLMDTVLNHDETPEMYYAEFGEETPNFRVSKWPVNKFKPDGEYFGFNEPYSPSCHILSSHFVICQDGRVPVCCFDYDCTVCAGNVSFDSITSIAEHGFDSIVDKIKARDFSNMPACSNCFDMTWRDKLPRERFVDRWTSCIPTT